MSNPTVFIKNEEGEAEELKLSAFLSKFESEEEVPDFIYEEDETGASNMSAEEVTMQLYQLAAAGKDLPEIVNDYSDWYKTMKKYLKDSKELAGSKKDQAEKAKKEAEEAKEKAKAEKEAAKAKIAQRKNLFLESAEVGFSQSDDRFRDQLISLRDSLPAGVKIKTEGDSFAMDFDDDVKEEDLASALGFMFNAQSQNEFMSNAYQFLIGDIANELHARGVYDSMIQCGKALEAMIFEKFNKKLSGRNVESYARMAKRIDIGYRNAKADPTAYLLVSDMPYPAKPSKKDIEDPAELKTAMHLWEKAKEKLDADRVKLAEILRDGKVTTEDKDGNSADIEILARRDIAPLVHQVKVKHGLAKEADQKTATVTDHMRMWAEATLILENFVGVHKKGVAIVHPGNDKDATIELTVADLNEKIEESKNALINMLYGNAEDFAELVAGEKTVQKVRMEDKTVGDKTTKAPVKDESGNVVKDDVQEKVYVKFLALRA